MVLLSVFILLGVAMFWLLGFSGWNWSLIVLGASFLDYSFDLLVEDISVVCLFMLLFCGGVALFYCFHYFGSTGDAFLLYPLMVWFLGVMGILVFSGSVLLSLVLWEYLGLVSFFLILFYSNSSSLRASLITLLVSRFGDVALFLLVMWGIWWFEVCYWPVALLLCLVVLTKSAAYPFVSWLLEAMRAPTPVSSLVHSSTLVAAGVWYFFRYGHLFSSDCLSVILGLCMLTIFISGFCALFFTDLKKLVALSTCNNVSWCALFYICGDLDLALLQLITHGVCKCYLFMSVGDLMGLSGSSQSSVGVYLSRYTGGFGVFVQGFLVMSLCGLPFMGVFFSKHLLFSEALYTGGFGYFCFMFLGLTLSYAYSMRLALLLLKGLGGLVLGYCSYFIIVGVLSSFGTVLNVVGVGSIGESVALSSLGSFLIMLSQLLGLLAGGFLFVSREESVSLSPASLVFSDSLVKSCYLSYFWAGEASVVSFYRWELYLLSLWPRNVSSFILYGPSALSFNIFILGGVLLSWAIFFVL